MSVVILCRPRLMRDLLAELFGRLPQGVRQACEQPAQLCALDPGDILLLVATGPFPEQMAQLQAVRQHEPRASVVLVGGAATPDEVERLRLAGAGAVISDDSPTSTLVGVVCMVQAGFDLKSEEAGVPVPSAVRPRIDGNLLPLAEPRSGLPSLSPQEVRILTRLMSGRSNKDIAGELGITEATVKVHLRACYEKIGARNRTQAAMWAAAHWPRSA
jgi:DNA-binding NarL/FixJ family response regulator